MTRATARRPADRPAARRDPEGTRRRILEAALAEFAAKGLSGARIDQIARRAGANKRMLYHYFGPKEALYLAALEAVFQRIRARELGLRLEHQAPEDAMRTLVRSTWDYFLEHPEFISLLNNENIHAARHLRRSARIRDLQPPLVALIENVLRRGTAAGAFRPDVDPVQLYISIAALGYFYVANRHTLSTTFARDLEAPEALAERRQHIEEVVLGYLRP